MSNSGDTGARTLTDGSAGGMGRWISLGVAVYLVFGLGTTISVYLLAVVGNALGPAGAIGGTSMLGLFGDGGLAGSIGISLVAVVFLSAGLATGLGLLIGRNVGSGASATTAGAASAGAGTFVASVILFVLLLLLGSGAGVGTGGARELIAIIGGFVGLTIGVAITGAVAASVGERSGTW